MTSACLTREAIAAAHDAYPGIEDGQERVNYYATHFGQMFGWIAQPDAFFLTDWLPKASKDYPHRPMRVVEVGTYGGSTARGLVTLLRGARVTSIDNFVDVHAGVLNGRWPDAPSFWHDTISGMGNTPDLSAYAHLVVGESAEIGRAWMEPIDLLFVDGDHAYEPAKLDIELYSRHVVPGGYVLVDDMDMPPVARAAGEFYAPAGWELVRQPSENTAKIAIWRRRTA